MKNEEMFELVATQQYAGTENIVATMPTFAKTERQVKAVADNN